MGRKLTDLSGERFGKLTVLDRAADHIQSNGRHNVQWRCLCDCGNIVVVRADKLSGGRTKSCGCYRKDNPPTRTHGMSKSRLFSVWQGMKNRCTCPHNGSYSNYGGRGIKVCDEWQEFRPFYDWAMSSGYTDSMTIDRINVNGNYCPENCQWITMKEQANNKRNNHLLTYKGETRTMTAWAELYGIRPNKLQRRLNKGWTIEEALNAP